MREGRERDLILAPGEYAFILDETKGNVITYVGPYKTSLANTDRPVIFNKDTRRFDSCNLEKAIIPFPFAEEGSYIVLTNPAEPGDGVYPVSGANNLSRLTYGRKLNIPGPSTFTLWPGQIAEVIEGHLLRSNQYLVVKVYSEEAARENWKKAIVKPQKAGMGEAYEGNNIEEPVLIKEHEDIPELTTGKIMIVKGTDVSFYIPPTGVEVIKDENDSYVRNAVTLERMEYCILLDEDGNKRFIQGPAVVFPKPTEDFIEKEGSRKFKAIELNEISGIHIKVIAPYKDKDGTEFKGGEELFITGKEQMIYLPGPEHVIIKYGNREIHHAIAIPAGEARYVLNRITGEIKLNKGPCMFLPDPRKEIIVRRVLEPRMVNLIFPGDKEALRYNRWLMSLAGKSNAGYVTEYEVKSKLEEMALLEMKEENDFSNLILDTRYEGAITIDIWTGKAILVVSKSGERRVVAGPRTYHLKYDEVLEPMVLSTGKPKNDDKVIKTVYIRVLNNKVSDIVSAETKDLCQVKIHVSYRVNFEGDPNKWFNVENYVKFLTENMRSIIRNTLKQKGIEEVYSNSTTIIRDLILGSRSESGERKGRFFEENNMRVYDVEVLDIIIDDNTVSQLLKETQYNTVEQAIKIAKEERGLEMIRKIEDIKRQVALAQSETSLQSLVLNMEEVKKELELDISKINSSIEKEEKELQADLNKQEKLTAINSAELERKRDIRKEELEYSHEKLQHRLEELQAEVSAVAGKAEAISPDFIAALQAFGDKHLAEKMSESLAPLAILGGKSIADVFSQLLKDTPVENVLKRKE